MNWSERPVLVTGAAGFLGTWLCQALARRGADVIALVRDEAGSSRFGTVQSQLTVVRGQLEDAALMSRILHQYEIATVFHLGAQALVGVARHDPVSTFESNIRGTWNLLDACRRCPSVKQILVASSDKAYGMHEGGLYRENARLDGLFPYDVSKSCADMLCRSYHATYDLPVTVTRCGNFFGGGDLNWSRLVPGTMRSLVAGQAPVIRSNGKLIRDYLYIEDAVEAYLRLAEVFHSNPSLAGEAFNFSLEQPRTVLELTEMILRVAGSRLEPKVLDLPETRYEIPVQMLSAEKARERLAWKPRFGLEEGLRKSWEWYSAHLENRSLSERSAG